jgi:hypothetical protein
MFVLCSHLHNNNFKINLIVQQKVSEMMFLWFLNFKIFAGVN